MLQLIGYVIGLGIGAVIWIVGFGGILEWIINIMAKIFGETKEQRIERTPKRRKMTYIIMAILLVVCGAVVLVGQSKGVI